MNLILAIRSVRPARAHRSTERGITATEFAVLIAAIILPLVVVINQLEDGVTSQIDDNATRAGTPAEISYDVQIGP